MCEYVCIFLNKKVLFLYIVNCIYVSRAGCLVLSNKSLCFSLGRLFLPPQRSLAACSSLCSIRASHLSLHTLTQEETITENYKKSKYRVVKASLQLIRLQNTPTIKAHRTMQSGAKRLQESENQ